LNRTTAFVRASIASVAASLLLAAGASANPIIVDVGTDNAGAGCELREAIVGANMDSANGGCALGNGADAITIAIPGGPPDQVTLVGDAPEITSDLTITGGGPAGTIIDGNGEGGTLNHRVLTMSGGTVQITGVTLQDGGGEAVGVPTTVQGGAIYKNGGALTLDNVLIQNNLESVVNGGTNINVFVDGGGIFNNAGDLTVQNSTISQNHVDATQSNSNAVSAFARGAGIFNNSGNDLSITNTTIDGNQATATRNSGPASQATAVGGGVLSNGKLTMKRSTVSNNTTTGTSADNDVSVQAQSAGLQLADDTVANTSLIELSTIASNRSTATCTGCAGSAQGGEGVLATNLVKVAIVSTTFGDNGPNSGLTTPPGKNLLVQSGTTSLQNTILADPFGMGANCDVGGTLTNLGYNIDYSPDATQSCGLSGANQDLFTDPEIGQIAANGGTTQTFAIPKTSSAVDKGTNAGQTTPALDQRSLTRPSDWFSIADATGGNATDIGSFELQNTLVRTLTVNKAGSGSGSVTSDVGGINCGATCSDQFDDGQAVTLTATPDYGSQPATWSGCDSVNGSNQCLVTLGSNKSVTATFDSPAQPGTGNTTTTTPGPTGQRAAALKKCKKKKKGKKRKKCKRKANALPA
jgi:hypothetical protein